ncbi:MAG: tRNA (guanosine(37)-N1)-methyltransferase TrmD [Gammaproteobacteria bacterium]|nr:tRNA (guanosine(37)-N1)-methyltransferase TrmD [Gammaproteobacteria bacterium]
MRIDVVTLFPDMFKSITDNGITGRAAKSGILDLVCWNPRDFTLDKHRTVDDKPYGGGPGMLMKVQPLHDAINAAKTSAEQKTGKCPRVIYLSPQGKKLDQQAVKQLAQENLVLVAGRYEGIDERLVELDIDEEWSIGDYVLSGGELAAMVIIDATVRMQPGALGDDESAQLDSFMQGLLDHPHYTRPEKIDDLKVPSVLLSGDHKKIEQWRLKQALGRTWQRRPDLLEALDLNDEQQGLLQEFINEFKDKDQ